MYCKIKRQVKKESNINCSLFFLKISSFPLIQVKHKEFLEKIFPLLYIMLPADKSIPNFDHGTSRLTYYNRLSSYFFHASVKSIYL